MQIISSHTQPVYIIYVRLTVSFKELIDAASKYTDLLVWAIIQKDSYTLTDVKIVNSIFFKLDSSKYYAVKIGDIEDFESENGFSFPLYYLKFKNHSSIAEDVMKKQFYFTRQFTIDIGGKLVD